MRKSKTITLWLLAIMMMFCNLSIALSTPAFAEEAAADEDVMESYYWEIQSNNVEGWPAGPQIQCESGIVMDMDTNAVLYEKGIYDVRYPASITKIMTTLVALENGNINDTITFSDIVTNITADSTQLGIQPGEQLTLEQALYGIMLASANDLCMGVAEYIGGSYDNFIQMMNDKAAQLGCVSTHYVNPHGLHDENHYTCAYDMALIAQAAYQNEEFRKIVGTTQMTFPATNLSSEEKTFANHQKMLLQDSGYYYEWCTGGKTGYTDSAWCTLVTFAEKNGRRLVSVVFRALNSGITFEESTKLMNYGFDNFKNETVTNDLSEGNVANLLSQLSTNYGVNVPVGEEIHIPETTTVTLPATVAVTDLTTEAKNINGENRLYYMYNGQHVGYSTITVGPLPVEETETAQANITEETEATSVALSETQGITEVVAKSVNEDTALVGVGNIAQSFFAGDTLVKLGIVAAVLVLVLVFVYIFVMRHRKNSALKKERKEEEEARLEKAKEIDNKSTNEIEMELRAAMNAEKERQTRIQQKQIEKEESEQKLKEAEKIVDQIGEDEKK